MKYVRILAALLALCSPAAAQWQVQQNAIPLGRGAGSTGFGVVGGSGGAGAKCLIDTVPPTFGVCPGVASFNGRTGAVVPGSADYAAPQIAFTQTGTGAVAQTVSTKLTYSLNVKDFGATGSTKYLTDGAITTGTAVFTSATAPFTSGDVGKVIRVVGAGAAGATLSTTISGFANSTTVTLTANAGTTVSAKAFSFGTDDTAAIQAALNRAQALNTSSASVYLPNGLYTTTAPLSVTVSMRFYGDGLGNSFIFPALTTNGISVNTLGAVTIERLQIFYISNPSASYGISLNGTGTGTNGSMVRDVEVLNPYIGIGTINAVQYTIKDNKIYTPGFAGIQLNSVNVPDSGNGVVQNNFISDLSLTKIGIQFTSGGGTRILSNYVLNAAYGVQVSLLSGAATGMLTVADNFFDGIGAAGVWAVRQGTTGTFRNLLVNANHCNLSRACVYVPLDATGPWLTTLTATNNQWNDDGASGDFAFAVNSTNNFLIAYNTMQQTTSPSPVAITTGSSASNGVIGPNIKTGTFGANSISSTGTTTIAPN